MIEVSITSPDNDVELAKIKITKLDGTETHGNYSVEFAVNRSQGAVGLHQRSFAGFPRTKLNVLALLRQALNTLDEKELSLEDGTNSADMERKVRGTLPSLSSKEEGVVHHYRSSFWRR